MKVSIVVPVYRGKKYIDSLIGMGERNYEYAKSNGMELLVQLVFVNDYPEEPLSAAKPDGSPVDIEVFENPENQGIHRSRLNGLGVAEGDYIVFLDQDDILFLTLLPAPFTRRPLIDLEKGSLYGAEVLRLHQLSAPEPR